MRGLVKVAVIGTGHVGLVVAACLADMGHYVTGVDLPRTVEPLNQGKVGFFEPGLQEKVVLHVRRKQLHFTTRLDALCQIPGIIKFARGINSCADAEGCL